MSNQRLQKSRTLIKIAVKKTGYIAGKGAVADYEIVKAQIATDTNNNPVLTDCFYCEWLSSFGAVAIALQQESVSQPARVRIPYVKAILDALTSSDVKVYKNGRVDDAHTYTLTSSPDNYLEQNKFIEFQVKHYEVK